MRARHSGTRPAQTRLPRPARAPPRIRGSPARQLIKHGPAASRLRCRDHTWLKTEGSVASRVGLTCGDVRVSEVGPQEAPKVSADLGRAEGTLAAIQEATGTYWELAAARPDRFRADLSGAASGRPLTINLVSRRRHRHILLATSSRPNRSVSAAHVPFQACTPPLGWPTCSRSGATWTSCAPGLMPATHGRHEAGRPARGAGRPGRALRPGRCRRSVRRHKAGLPVRAAGELDVVVHALRAVCTRNPSMTPSSR